MTRTLDGVDPQLIHDIEHAADHVSGLRLQHVRARWLGHRLHAEVSVVTDPSISVGDAIILAEKFKNELRAHLPLLEDASIIFVTKD